jgi:ceramide glucosyltransferase
MWAWLLLALTFAARLAVGFATAELVLDDREIFRREVLHTILLLPLRDLLAPFLWAASFMGNRIHWRGEVFHLKDGRLSRSEGRGQRSEVGG